MKRLLTASGMLFATVCLVAALASDAGASGGKLKCFADSPATCTLNSATSATIDATQGGDAGVYLGGNVANGVLLQHAKFSFTYFCANTADITSCTGGGSPRWSIPINTDSNAKTTEGYAFMDGANCITGGTTTSGGALTVGTQVSTCPVFFGPNEYTNWADFASQNPTYRIASPGSTEGGFSAYIPFVISDSQTASAQIVSDVVAKKV